MSSRLGLRTRLLLAVLAAVTAALAAMIVGFNLLLAHNLSGDANNLVRARAATELSLIRSDGNGISLAEASDDSTAETNAWVFSHGRRLEAPRTTAVLGRAARQLAARAPRLEDVGSADTRLYAVPVEVAGRRLGTVVAAVSLAPYEETRRAALFGSLAFGAAVLLLVALAARWLLTSSLRPVARMTRQAAEWSERDLDRRFAVGHPTDELTELAATLDGLLDRLAASLRREQRFSAELSHELRTPLSRVIAETELALRRERSPHEYRQALELVLGNARQLTRLIDTLVAASRYETGSARGTADAFAVAAETLEVCEQLAGERNLDVRVEPWIGGVRVGVDADVAERILQPVVENACRYGRHAVSITLQRRNGAVVYVVQDDGPGVADDEREQIFEPGARGRAGRRNGSAGSGLGLALARRLARSASGEIDVIPSSAGGRFIVRLPAG